MSLHQRNKSKKAAIQLGPMQMEEWFNSAVYGYEKYKAEWDKFEARQ